MLLSWATAWVCLIAVGACVVGALLSWLVLRARLRQLALSAETWGTTCAHLLAIGEDTDRKLSETRATIAGILKERDDWQQLYWRSSAEAGNAQCLLMTERDRLCKQLLSLGHQPAVHPGIEAVVASFDDTHAAPSRAGLRALAPNTQKGGPAPIVGTASEGGPAQGGVSSPQQDGGAPPQSDGVQSPHGGRGGA